MTSEPAAENSETPASTIVHIPVSIGELWDKYTILLIKQERIHHHEKRSQVEYELGQLRPFMTNIERDYQSHPAFVELKHVNECTHVVQVDPVLSSSISDCLRVIHCPHFS